MRLTGEQWEGILELVEQQRELERQVAQVADQVDSEMIRTVKALQEIAEEQQDLARFLRGDVAKETLRAAQMLNSMPLEEYAAAAASAQQATISTGAIRAAREVVLTQQKVANQLVNNQAFLSAISQWQELADTVSSLQKTAFLTYYHYPSYSELEVESAEVEPSPYIPSLYDQAVDPYEPFRESVYEIQLLIAGYLLASTVDGGDFSEDLSEVEKQHVRNGLALLVGFAIGLPVGLIFGATGIPAGLGATALSANRFDSYYDKYQKETPEEDPE